MISRVPGGGGADGSDDVPAVRVLFVYPTYRNMLSPAIGLLAAVLKERGRVYARSRQASLRLT